MARMISELNSRQPASAQPREPRPGSPDSSIMSLASSQHSMVEAYGPAGLQLFVDAGQPVNPELVNDLVREALEEKIAAMLGQRQREPRTSRPIAVDQHREPSPGPPFVRGSPIPTPEVTPKASPIHTPPAAGSPLATPAASIAESSVVESEPDSLKDSMVVPEPPREATPEPLPAPTSPVTTPAATPPPTPPKAPTPELSPRESPVPLLLNETDLPTPSLTPEPVSPEPEVEEEKEETPPRTPEVPRTPTPPPPPPPPPPLPVESSESESETSQDVTTASVSETVGREISEGEWLISKSEGQVDLIPDALAARNMQIDTSSADSTMRGTEEIERDLQEPRSEGEIIPGKFGKINLTEDPVVALLAKLSGPLHSSPLTPHFRPPLPPADNGARSPGEVSLGQRPSLTPSTERFVYGQIEAEGAEGGFSNEDVPSVRRRLSPGELGVGSQQKEEDVANQQGVDSTLRISHLVRTNRQNSNPTILVGGHVDKTDPRKASPEAGEVKLSEASPSPRPSPRPRIISVAAPRVIQVGGRSPRSDRADKEEEVEEGEARGGSEGHRHSLDMSGMTPVEDLPADKPEERDAKRQAMPTGGIFGMQTMSDIAGTRTMTPDAINVDALLQSGYLSQTFSQSEAGTSDFERTGAYGHTFGTGQSGATPFGATQTMTEDSLEFPKKMKPEKGPRTFSVTLPSAQSMQDSSEGDAAQLDTISDVSEISAGDL